MHHREHCNSYLSVTNVQKEQAALDEKTVVKPGLSILVECSLCLSRAFLSNVQHLFCDLAPQQGGGFAEISAVAPRSLRSSGLALRNGAELLCEVLLQFLLANYRIWLQKDLVFSSYFLSQVSDEILTWIWRTSLMICVNSVQQLFSISTCFPHLIYLFGQTLPVYLSKLIQFLWPLTLPYLLERIAQL